MRVALMTPRFWPEVRRGTERFVHDLARELIRHGHEPVVITGARAPGRSVEEGVPVLRVRRLGDRALDRLRLEQHLGHLPWAAIALRRVRPDLVHTFHLSDALVAAASGRPGVYTHMGIPDAADLDRRAGRRRLTGFVARRLRVATLTDTAARAFREQTGAEAAAIPPGVDLHRFALGQARTPEPTVVCSAAAAEPRKRVRLLLDAWPEVRRAHPRARLFLDARGRRALGPLPDGADLVTMDDTPAMADLLGRAWAAVLPSFDEAFGLVALEALATGTPVVAATASVVDRPAIGRVFDDSEAGLAAALGEAFHLAGDPGTRLACRSRAEELSAERTAHEYLALYGEVLTAAASGGAARRGGRRRATRGRG
jgi:glycosyltransferase involved in cell wall biosynthesis